MNPQELRIGNITNLGIVTGIYEHNIGEYSLALYGAVSVPIEKFKPIPLTEQWLKRFGFEVKNPFAPNKAFNRNATKFPCELTKNVNGFWVLANIDKGMTICKYVHQLQNLYFALTGKELNESE